MNYKKIFRSRKLRNQILDIMSFVPDKAMLVLQYYIKTGRKLNIKNPKRFTEKLQLYKLYYRNPLMIQCADKYDVREYVRSLGLEEILNECYGVFEITDDINFDKLPDKFVLKDTLGSGGNSVIICKDKKSADVEAYKKVMHEWLNKRLTKSGGREWPYYSGKKHRIICERYLCNENEELIEYKFFCFYGVCKYFYVITERKMGESARLGIYDRNHKRIAAERCDEKPLLHDVKKPVIFEDMIKIAEKLSKPFPEARIDLYYYESKTLFGEITFFDGSGYMQYEPDEFDFKLGCEFNLK